MVTILGWTPTVSNLIFLGLLALLILVNIVLIAILFKRKKEDVPDTMPQKYSPESLGIKPTRMVVTTQTTEKDFRTILQEEIAQKDIRLSEIKLKVDELKQEYNTLKEELPKLKMIGGQLL